ncbi:MAG TPA: hypothetical protein P5235_10820 [Saprospiraceae bacterium]|nr:hypothetical protein [Saprospiraceae bacterium]
MPKRKRIKKSSPLCEQPLQRGRAENNMEKFQKNYVSNAVPKPIFLFFQTSRSSDKERKVGIAFSGMMHLGLLQFER